MLGLGAKFQGVVCIEAAVCMCECVRMWAGGGRFL